MVVVWIVALVGGIVVAAIGSRRAVTSALAVSERLGVSTGLVGVTVLAVGTDLPEIANSISASVTGHGDLNVGNATGSALTQITLVPLIRSVTVSDAAVAGTIVIAVGCAAATLVAAAVRHPPVTATLLVGVYAGAVLAVVLV